MAQGVGYAVLPVSVSIKGINAQLNKQIVGPAQNAAKKASDSVRKQLATGADAAAKAVESARRREEAATNKVVDAEKKLKSARDTAETKAKSVESAELKLQAARSTEKSKVADAEKKLSDLRDSGKATAEQLEGAERNLEAVRATQGAKVLDAEGRLQSARSASETATDKAKSAEDNLTTAKSRAASASEEVITATKNLDAANEGLSGSTASAEGAFGRLKSKLSDMKSELFGAKSEMDTAGSSASGMGSELESAQSKGDGLSNGLFDLGKKAGLAAIAFSGISSIGETIQAGFDKVNSIEDTTASLEIMMGSAGEATRVMDDLQASNQATPYTFDGWASAGKNLIAFGVDAEKASDVVTALGEAASASGKGESALNQMADSFGKAAASGKISLETINSLSQGGVEGLKILANDAGVSTAEMQKMISSGAVPAADAIDVLTKGIMEGSQGAAGETKALTGTMEAMSETTSGRLTNMKSAFTNLAGSVMGAVAPAISVAAEKITEFVYAIKGWVDGLIDGEGAMSGVKKAIDVMMPVLKPLAFIIGSAAAALTAMKLASLAYQGAALLAGKATQALSMAMGALLKHPIVAAIAAIVGGLIYFFTQTETGKKVWDELMEKLKVVGAWISDTFGPIFERLGEIISGAWDGIKVAFDAGWSAIQPIFDVMGAVFSTIWDGLQLAWSAIGQPILDLIVGAFGLWWQGVKLYFDFLKNLFTTVWDGLKIAWNAVGQPVLNVIIGAFNIMKEGLALAFRLVRASFEVLWEAVKRAWDAIGRPIVDFIVAVFNRWWSGMQRIFGWVRAGWSALWVAVRAGWDAVGRPVVDTVVSVFGWFRDKIKAAFDIVSGFASDLWNDISNFFGKIFTKIGEVKDKVLQPFKDAGSWLVDAGKNIIDGLLNGIGDLGKKIADWFLDKIPGWIKEPFKKALGIRSPSRVFAGFGKNIGEGLINGIDGMAGKVEKSAQGMADRVSDVDMPEITANVDSSALSASVQVSATATAPAPNAGAETATAGASALQQSADTMQTAATGQLDPMWQQQDAQITGFGQTMQDTATGVVTPVFNTMAAGLQAAKSGVIDPVFSGVQSGLGAVGNQFTAQTQAVIGPMWNSMGANLDKVKTGVVDPTFTGVEAGLQSVGKKFTDSVNSVMNPVWKSMGDHVKAIQTGTITPTFNTVESGLSHLSGWFSTTVGNIGTAWDRMRSATGKPAKFVVQTVFNDGIKKAWDSISDMIGEKKMKSVPLGGLGGYATGGVLPGYTPGKDVHHFSSPTGGRVSLSGGEAIMRPEWTRAVGGKRAVDQMNAAARSGKLGRGQRMGHAAHADGGVYQAFAEGGIVNAMTRIVQKKYPMLTMTSGQVGRTGGLHGAGMAADFSNGSGNTPQQLALARDIAKTYPNSAELIYDSPGWAGNIKNGQNVGAFGQFYTMAQAGPHHHHVHWGMNTPPTMPFGGGVFPGGSAGGAGAVMVSMTEMVKDAWDAAIKKIPKFTGGKGSFGGVPPKWQDKAESRTWKHIKKQADKMETAGGLVSSAGVNGSNRQMGKQMAARVGWTGSEWNALEQLWTAESQWNHLAQNPTSTAYGIPQFLDSTWATVGGTKTSDPKKQIQYGIKYIQQRPDYGVPSKAWALWNSRSPHWYADGGVLPENLSLFDQGGYLQDGKLAKNESGKPEPVFTASQWSVLRQSISNTAALVPPIQKWVNNGLNELERIANTAEKGFREWASENEDHGRLGSPEEIAAHYGGQAAKEFGADALSLIGLDGLADITFSESFVNLVNAASDTIRQETGHRFGHIRQDSLQPYSALDDDLRRAKTDRESAPVASSAETESPEPAQAAAAQPQQQESAVQITLEGNAYTADQVEKMLTQVGEKVQGVDIRVSRIEKAQTAAVTAGVTMLA